jgi:membrane protein YdbS with pleckstrin-like domain
MFCQACGNQIEDGAKFCSKCGSSTTVENVQKTSLSMPIFVIRPVLIPWATILSVIPIQLFMTVWAGGFFGGFGMLAVEFLDINLPTWFTFVFFGALAFFGIPFLVYYAKKNTYSKTKYKFYADKLEYTEGFWTAENKTIKYKNITETYLRRGVIQKKYGIGTIILSAPATNNYQGVASSGIKILDIENPEKIYERVQLLIDKAT